MGNWPEGHSGPILNHMAYCGPDSCTGVDATSLDWFAIHHSGYDATNKIWPTDVLATTGATHTINLPTDLPGGAYLLRFELIAMHSVPAQFYPWAAEVTLTSDGASGPSSEYLGKFPDMYSAAANNMALDFSLYTGNDLMSFVLPGVPVYPGGSSAGNDPRPDGSAGPAAAPAPGNGTVPTAESTTATGSDPATTSTASDVGIDPSLVPSTTEAVPAITGTGSPDTAPVVPSMTEEIPAEPTTTTDGALPGTDPTGSAVSSEEPAQTSEVSSASSSSIAVIPVTTSLSADMPSGSEGATSPAIPTGADEPEAVSSFTQPTQGVTTDTEAPSSTVQAVEPT